MNSEQTERRLMAILIADVAGYSRLIGTDDEGTLAQLNAHHSELVAPKINEHRGRVVRTTGDGLLVLFASVVGALRCAVEVQRGMAERNAQVPPDKRIEFRMGINVGDLIEGASIHGDGVNVAARLEALAEVGGICVSGRVQEDVRGSLGRLGISFEDTGQHQLKNIDRPVQVYRVLLHDATATVDRIELSSAIANALQRLAEGGRRWPVRATAAALAVAAVLSVVTSLVLFGARPYLPRTNVPAKPIAAGTMPIIAVLPFANQTGDNSQEYFADGVTEEVINALGRFNTLRVVGRNAVQRYKKQPSAQGEIASELGANYLVEGSVRRAGQRVRIAAQLTELRAGTVMWTDRYDGELADIFEFQDTIARRIAGTLAANITLVEGRRHRDHPRPDQSAYDLVLRARAIGHALSRTANREVRELMTKAIELDPNYAAAHALFAEALRSMALLGWTEFTDRELTRGEAEARKAISLAPNEPDGHRALGRILLVRGEYEQAQNALKRAIEINPSDVNALASWGLVQSYSGDIADCIDSLQLAMKLNPMLEPNMVFELAVCFYLLRRHEDALRTVERGQAHYSDFLMFNALAAAAAAQLGRKEQATRYVEALRPFLPLLDLDRLGSRFKDPAHHAYLREGLTLAGL